MSSIEMKLGLCSKEFMRVVSLIPSWTETLIEAGVNVVGRTRFCIHPSHRVQAIPVVGGTKDVHLQKVEALQPDCVLLDKEENTLETAKQLSGFAQVVSHVESVEDLPKELNKLGEAFHSKELHHQAQKWTSLLKTFNTQSLNTEPPGLMEWIRPLQAPPKKLVYLIWSNPWMAVSEHTFIGSVLKLTGYSEILENFPSKYPEINISEHDSKETLFLASSEPFPFAKKKHLFNDFEGSVALVDGEVFSWFGVRTLNALTKLSSKAPTR